MSTTPSGLVSPDNPSGFPYDPEASTIPPVWEHVIAVFMKLPPTTAEGLFVHQAYVGHN